MNVNRKGGQTHLSKNGKNRMKTISFNAAMAGSWPGTDARHACIDTIKGSSYRIGRLSKSFRRFMGYSRYGGVLCQSRLVCFVFTSNRSKNGLFPSGEAPPPEQ